MNSRNLIITITLVLISLIAWQLRWVLLVLFGAVVLSVALDVIICKLQSKLPISRYLALTIVLIILVLAGLFGFILLVPELITQVKELGTLLPTLIAKIKSIIATQPRLIGLEQSIPEQLDWDRIQPLWSKLVELAGGVANSLMQLILMSLLAILLALDPESHREIVLSVTPNNLKDEINELLDLCRIALGGWLAGMTISAGSIFILTWIGLLYLQVPLALLSALICGVLTFVPIIGPTIATILPLGIALLLSPSVMLQVLIFRLILQNLEAFVLTPILLSRTVNLLPTIALMSQLSLGVLLGLPGVLLALPLAVVLQVAMHKLVSKTILYANN